jgi:HEAT repeat protein
MLLWPRGDVLEVNGFPFRLWVAQHSDFQIQDPLAAVGTNAIPHLIRILREPAESPRAFQVKSWIWKHLPRTVQSKFQRWQPVLRRQLKRTALFGLRFLGPEAKAALPEVLRLGHAETDAMVRASALTAALAIAPESPETFAFWREEWNGTNYSRHDLAVYLRSARYPILAATPLLLNEAKRTSNPVTIVEAFEFFGEGARPAVPYMRKVFNNERTFRGNMLKLYRGLGPVAAEAVPDLAAILTNEDPAMVAGALEALKSIGPDARAALPRVQTLVTNRDSTIRMLAASASACIQAKPDLAVPILLDGLQRPVSGTTKARMTVTIGQPIDGLVTGGPEAAAILLGECGPAASAAMPALEEKLQDNNQWMRLASAQAIWRISGTANQALPVLLAILDSQPQPQPGQASAPDKYLLIRTIEAIEEMGPAAKDAIPSLKRVRTFSMLARKAVDSALAQIEATP